MNKKINIDDVFKKMNHLKNQHLKQGSRLDFATTTAFEYGRELIGFDLAEAWRMGAIGVVRLEDTPCTVIYEWEGKPLFEGTYEECKAWLYPRRDQMDMGIVSGINGRMMSVVWNN